MVLLVAGIAISVFPTQETYTTHETVTVDEWPLQQYTLPPQDSTFYGKYMNPEQSFRLNISSLHSDGSPAPIKVTVSLVQHAGEDTTKLPIPDYPQTASNFNKEVSISSTGTYFIDIMNENPFSVTLNGKALVQQKQEKTNFRTTHPYVFPGVLTLAGGAIILAFGIFRRPKRLLKHRGARK